MRNFIATAVLALAVQATKEVDATIDVTHVDLDVVIDPEHEHDHEGYEQGPVLMDYVTVEGEEIDKHMEVDEHVTVDDLVIVDDPYTKSDLISVDGEVCEHAVGHDGHYDPITNEWMLEDDMDYEPEWRCLMRPLLREAVVGVGAAELSIESKGILEEKQALVNVHKRLVEEAEKAHDKATCIEYLERKMSKYQECELQVLRQYVVIEAAYPTSWVAFLEEKKVCVNTFAAEVAECSRMFLWN